MRSYYSPCLLYTVECQEPRGLRRPLSISVTYMNKDHVLKYLSLSLFLSFPFSPILTWFFWFWHFHIYSQLSLRSLGLSSPFFFRVERKAENMKTHQTNNFNIRQHNILYLYVTYFLEMIQFIKVFFFKEEEI